MITGKIGEERTKSLVFCGWGVVDPSGFINWANSPELPLLNQDLNSGNSPRIQNRASNNLLVT